MSDELYETASSNDVFFHGFITSDDKVSACEDVETTCYSAIEQELPHRKLEDIAEMKSGISRLEDHKSRYEGLLLKYGNPNRSA